MMTTLKKTDGTITINLEETMETMAEHLIPKDDATDDTEQHKKIRLQEKEKNTNKRRQRIYSRID